MNIEDVRKYKYWKYPMGNLRYNIWEIRANEQFRRVDMRLIGVRSILYSTLYSGKTCMWDTSYSIKPFLQSYFPIKNIDIYDF